jgi:hypothetical protein
MIKRLRVLGYGTLLAIAALVALPAAALAAGEATSSSASPGRF